MEQGGVMGFFGVSMAVVWSDGDFWCPRGKRGFLGSQFLARGVMGIFGVPMSVVWSGVKDRGFWGPHVWGME